jgi:hypothetical protein
MLSRRANRFRLNQGRQASEDGEGRQREKHHFHVSVLLFLVCRGTFNLVQLPEKEVWSTAATRGQRHRFLDQSSVL